MSQVKETKKKVPGKVLAIRIGAVVLLLLVAALMMLIGRGHTIYLDNKTVEVEGQTIEAFHKVTVYSGSEKVAKLSKRDRGMCDNIGQSVTLTVDVVREKEGDTERYTAKLKLPYSMDGILINIPAYVAGLPEADYLSEYIIEVVEEDTEDEGVPGAEEELGLGGER